MSCLTHVTFDTCQDAFSSVSCLSGHLFIRLMFVRTPGLASTINTTINTKMKILMSPKELSISFFLSVFVGETVTLTHHFPQPRFGTLPPFLKFCFKFLGWSKSIAFLGVALFYWPEGKEKETRPPIALGSSPELFALGARQAEGLKLRSRRAPQESDQSLIYIFSFFCSV